MTSSTPESLRANGRRPSARGFTLVELIVVMVLLLIVASMVAPRMSSFFRGRALSQEARRMLSLINYGRSRAVAEGVPVLVWIDADKSTYGLDVQPGYQPGSDHLNVYTAEPTLRFEIPATTDAPVSEQGDEQLGLPQGLPAIRFNPDGFSDEASIRRIIIRQGDDGALEIVPTPNGLGYEIRPVTNAN